MFSKPIYLYADFCFESPNETFVMHVLMQGNLEKNYSVTSFFFARDEDYERPSIGYGTLNPSISSET
jgi:hypothetical protein